MRPTKEQCLDMLTDIDYFLAHNDTVEKRREKTIELLQDWFEKLTNLHKEVILDKEEFKLEFPTPEKFTLFYGGIFSQWYPCKIVIDDVVYNCAEQFMMAEKAILFKDLETLEKIMSTDNPAKQKKLGKEVRAFEDAQWLLIAKDVVYRGSYAKYTQNPGPLVSLLSTKGTTLVEASPYDRRWGIGLAASDPSAQVRKKWQGQNWLGEILTKLREELSK